MIRLHPLYRAGEIAPGVQYEIAELVEFAERHDVGTFNFICPGENSEITSDLNPGEYLGSIIAEGANQANVRLSSFLSRDTIMPLYNVASVQLIDDRTITAIQPED